MTTEHARYRELAAGHALYALEPEDEIVLLEHLPSCDACSRELVVHRDTLGQLAYASEPLEPPASLFGGIRSAVEAESPDAFRAPAPVQDLRSRRERADRRLPSRPQMLVAAAASIVIAGLVALGAWNLTLQRENAQQDQWSEALRSAVSAIVDSPDRTEVQLPDASGEVVAVAVLHDDTVNLVVDGLEPNNTETSTYVLWGQANGGHEIALATFDVSQGVRAVPAAGLPVGLQPAPDLLAVTLEEGRSAPASSNGRPVVQATLPS